MSAANVASWPFAAFEYATANCRYRGTADMTEFAAGLNSVAFDPRLISPFDRRAPLPTVSLM